MGLVDRTILAGDWRFFWPETLRDLAHTPFAWDSFVNTGVGQSALGTLWITSYLHATSFLTHTGLSWFWIGLFFWQIPSILVGFFGMYVFSRRVFSFPRNYAFLAGFLYVANTYFCMLFFGGQAGICLAYGILPIVLLRAVVLVRSVSLQNSIWFGLAISLLLLFDPRVLYLSVLAVMLLLLFEGKKEKLGSYFMYVCLLPSFILISLHIFWIIPLLVYQSTGVSEYVGGVESFRYFSFAGFDYAFSWLHPNWPENVFGKIRFLNPIFLLFPLIAFSSLFFFKSHQAKSIIFLVFLAIFAAFFAKGAKEPFSVINVFAFQYMPGMSLFRDSTKFYILLSFSYALLIPYALLSLTTVTKLIAKHKRLLQNGLPIAMFILCLFILYDATKYQKIFIEVPDSYKKFHEYLVAEKEYSRTLWIPTWQRFGYFSANHPAIGRNEFLKDTSVKGVHKFFARKDAEKLLNAWAVRYIIIPDDSQKEIFLNDREYSEAEKNRYIDVLDKVTWLKKDISFAPMVLYVVSGPSNHFSMRDEKYNVVSKYISPSLYRIAPRRGTIQGELIFAESFSPFWKAKVGENSIASKQYGGMNMFILPEGTKEVFVIYQPQNLVNLFLFLSLFSSIFWVIVALMKKKYA